MDATEPQDVVVYDQSTRDASVLAADSFLSILLSKLDGCFDSVAILTGELQGWARAVGYLLFQALLPMRLASTRSLRGEVLSRHYWDGRAIPVPLGFSKLTSTPNSRRGGQAGVLQAKVLVEEGQGPRQQTVCVKERK